MRNIWLMMYWKVLNVILKYIKQLLQRQKTYGLRQNIQEIRDNCESFHYELFKVAQLKDYYIPDIEAKEEEIEQVKKEING